MNALRRALAVVLAASLAAAPLRAAEIEASFSAPLPLAGPQWMQAFAVAAIPGTPADCGPLAAALMAGGVTPERLARAGTQAQAILDVAAVAYVRNLVPASPRALDNGVLALRHLQVTAAQHALAPYLSPAAAAGMAQEAAPFFDVVRQRQLLDDEGRLLRTAAALGLATANMEDAGLILARPSSPSLRLARPVDAGPKPARPSPRAPQAPRYASPHPVARFLRLAAFSGALIGLFAGRAPVVFADMDETIAPSQQRASGKMIRAIADILKSGGSYGILTGSSFEAARQNVVEPLRRELGGDAKILERLVIAARSGSQIYRFDPKSGEFRLKRVGALDGFLISKGVHDGLDKIRAVLGETVRKYGLKAQKGELIIEDRVQGTDVLTQFVLVPTGNAVSKEDKRIFDAQGGRKQRETYAAYINQRLRDLGVPVEARVAGKTSIDVGVDKSLGFQALTEELAVSPKQVLWAGDSHGEYGNDAPAAKMAGLVLNVGPRADFDVPAFQEREGGPAATLAYYRIVGLYARASAWWRAHFQGRRSRR